MMPLLRDRLFVVWLILVAVTLLSSRIGGADGLARSGQNTAVTITVLAIAFGKVAAVMFTYMDLRTAPMPLRIVCGAWLVVVLSVLIATYLGAF